MRSRSAALLSAAACALLAAAPIASADVAPPAAAGEPYELPPPLVPITVPSASPKFRLAGAPFAYYSPESAWGFGAGGLLWFHADPVAKAAGRVSAAGASLQYTLREQAAASAIWDLYLSEGRLRMSGALCNERWPNQLWGPGAAGGARGESYTARSFKAEAGLAGLAVDVGRGRGLWLGVQARGRADDLRSLEPDGMLDRCGIAGCRGGRVYSLAATAAWDTRDQVFSPRRGVLLSARAGGGVSSLDGPDGGSSGFVEGELDARTWLPLAVPRGARLALQARLQAAAGTVPFYVRPTFGGDRSLRGVREGRWRDLTALSVQAEYAVPLFWRLGAGIFGGAGQVAPRPGDLAWKRFVPAGGAGLRVTVDRADRVFLRLDRGYSPGFSTWYVTFGEAI